MPTLAPGTIEPRPPYLDVNHDDPVNNAIRALIRAARGLNQEDSSLCLEEREALCYQNLLATIVDFDVTYAPC